MMARNWQNSAKRNGRKKLNRKDRKFVKNDAGTHLHSVSNPIQHPHTHTFTVAHAATHIGHYLLFHLFSVVVVVFSDADNGDSVCMDLYRINILFRYCCWQFDDLWPMPKQKLLFLVFIWIHFRSHWRWHV